jgi:cytochrome c oxidase cbb3-type subunit IV
MDVNLLREAVTVLSFAVFMGIVWYAMAPRNGAYFDKAAQLPPDEEGR